MPKNPHIGSDFEDYLREEGILDQVDARVHRRVIAEQLRAAMRADGVSEVELATRMETSRTVVRNLLDENGHGATLLTLVKAAHAVGHELEVSLARIQVGGKRKRPAPKKARTAPRAS